MYNEGQDILEHFNDVQVALESLKGVGFDVERKADRALDIGGGLAMHAGFLIPHAHQTVCTDLRHYCAEYGGQLPKLIKEKFERHGHPFDLTAIELQYADAMDLPFRDDWFDLVTSFNAFEHIPEPSVALTEMVRVAKPGAYLFLTFDPIWTADTGSHFSHLVTEPWAHLVLGEEAFRAQMRAAGASESDLSEFPRAMNQRRLSYYDAMFASEALGRRAEVVHSIRWDGFAHAAHRTHPNHEHAKRAGYSETELETRGMRVILRKRVAPITGPGVAGASSGERANESVAVISGR